MQDYMANFQKIKQLMPGLSAFQTMVAACKPEFVESICAYSATKADLPILNLLQCCEALQRPAFRPVLPLSPKHRSNRPLYFDAPEFRQVHQLLDVGGGPGLVASLLKEENPHIKITVFDLPAVCDHALDIFRESGQGRDLGAHPGDFFKDPFPSGFRAIQFSHVLEIFPEERILELLKKAYAALPRGGKLFIYGAAADEASAGTGCYCLSDYLKWLPAAGFSSLLWRRDTSSNVFLKAVK